ncbi:hypothetical protein [Clostridium grantii]|uniref:hypothetical protein n=1 Tax=Clostridium grantii TaxID=40575 RepID=UPI000A871E43
MTNGLKWNSGYQSISIIQIVLVICLIISLPLWKTKQEASESSTQEIKSISLKEALKLPGAKAILTAFFCYCSLEA